MLGFKREEEAGCEVLDVVDAGHMIVWQLKAEITMGENDEVPDAGKDDPGDDEGGGEAEQGPGPRQVDHGGEEVFEEPVRLLVLLRSPVRVQSAVFRNHSVSLRVSVDHSKDTKPSGKRIPPEICKLISRGLNGTY